MKDPDTKLWDKLLVRCTELCPTCAVGLEPECPLHDGNYYHLIKGEWIPCLASAQHQEITDLLDEAGML